MLGQACVQHWHAPWNASHKEKIRRTSWNSWRRPATSPAAEQLKMRGSGPSSSCLHSGMVCRAEVVTRSCHGGR
jgi:hypothetical protein